MNLDLFCDMLDPSIIYAQTFSTIFENILGGQPGVGAPGAPIPWVHRKRSPPSR